MRNYWLLFEHCEDEFIALLLGHNVQVLLPQVKCGNVGQVEARGHRAAHFFTFECSQLRAVVRAQRVLQGCQSLVRERLRLRIRAILPQGSHRRLHNMRVKVVEGRLLVTLLRDVRIVEADEVECLAISATGDSNIRLKTEETLDLVQVVLLNAVEAEAYRHEHQH